MKTTGTIGIAGLLAAGIVAATHVSAAEKTVDMSKPVRELQEEFLKLKFGMFICYNMATFKTHFNNSTDYWGPRKEYGGKPVPPNGHVSLWMEEAQMPESVLEAFKMETPGAAK